MTESHTLKSLFYGGLLSIDKISRKGKNNPPLTTTMPRSYGNPLQYDYDMDTENNIYDAFRDSKGCRHYDNGRYAPCAATMMMAQVLIWTGIMRANIIRAITMNYATPAKKQAGNLIKWDSLPAMKKWTNVPLKNGLHQMKNEDDSSGPHWNMEQAKQIMQQNGIDSDPAEFYAALNMMYSDYGKVAKKYGVNESGYYAHLTKAFLDDKDAGDGKLMRYYECVVK